jgi:hypothetical protein
LYQTVKKIKQAYPYISLEKLCGLFRVTRQAYYEAYNYEKKTSIAHMIVLRLVQDLRDAMPEACKCTEIYIIVSAITGILQFIDEWVICLCFII